MSDRALLLVRGWVAAIVATLAAVLAHAAAGGHWPHPLLVVLCASLSAPVCMLLARVRWPAPLGDRGAALAACVVAAQGLYHALFEASGSYAPSGASVAHAGHHHAVTSAAAGAADPSALLVPVAHAAHGGALAQMPGAMTALHAAAGLITFLCMRRGEQDLLRLLRLMTRSLLAAALLLRPAPLPGPQRTVPQADPRAAGPELLLDPARPLRGPPSSGVALAA